MPSCRGVLRGLLPVVGFLVGALGAGEACGDEPLQVSISPFAGYRVGGGFRLNDTDQQVSVGDHGAFAIAVDLGADDGREYELFYSRQSTDLRGNGFVPASTVVEYLHIGGTVELADEGRVKPYFAGGIGVTRLSPGAAAGNDDTRFSVSLGLGLRAPLSQHFSLRFEARGYYTALNTDTALFCRSDQGGGLCQVRARGSALFQGDFLAGVSYAF